MKYKHTSSPSPTRREKGAQKKKGKPRSSTQSTLNPLRDEPKNKLGTNATMKKAQPMSTLGGSVNQRTKARNEAGDDRRTNLQDDSFEYNYQDLIFTPTSRQKKFHPSNTQ